MPDAPAKRRIPKIRPVQATPKEKMAWDSFEELIKATGSTPGNVAPIVQAELERLCQKGHPLALRLKERIKIAEDRPRHQTEHAKPPPEARRIQQIHWTHGKPDEDI